MGNGLVFFCGHFPFRKAEPCSARLPRRAQMYCFTVRLRRRYRRGKDVAGYQAVILDSLLSKHCVVYERKNKGYTTMASKEIDLTEEEQIQLKEIVRKGVHNARVIARARVLVRQRKVAFSAK